MGEKIAEGQSAVCRVRLQNGALVAELRGIAYAPDRQWNRIQDAKAGLLFSRYLTAAEAFRFLKSHEVPPDLGPIHIDCDKELDSIYVFPRVAIPLILVDDQEGQQLHIRIALKHPSRAKILQTIVGPGIQAERGYFISKESYVAFDSEAIQTILDISGKEGMDLLRDGASLSFRSYQKLRRALIENCVPIQEAVNLPELIERLRQKLDEAILAIPKGLKLELYKYQEDALRWLQFCYDQELGCLLADEMGLGKTPTAIAFIASKVFAGEPNLVVCPTSILENWIRELHKFCPSLKTALHHGASRLFRVDEFKNYDVIVTSYGTVRNDIALLSGLTWNIVILDEAQKIKNPDSGVSVACRHFRARCPLAITGTPFENRPLDLWSVMDFVEPGFLGTQGEFREQYGEPISSGDERVIEELEKTVRLFMMRRLKKDVRTDLPPKIEIDQPIAMTVSEARRYSEFVQNLKREARLHGITANTITPLRQLCCHPKLLEPDWNGDPFYACGKYQRLVELIEKIIEMDEKFLIFSSFLRMLDILEKDLSDRFGIPVYRIDGSVQPAMRQQRIDSFSGLKGSATMVLNPQAAGLGLNIVAANHVIHYNREWNPAVEDQATDRTHRGGQQRDVTVHYLFYVDTIDQIISDRLSEKRQLAGQLISASANKDADREAILAALELIPTHTITDIPDEDSD